MEAEAIRRLPQRLSASSTSLPQVSSRPNRSPTARACEEDRAPDERLGRQLDRDILAGAADVGEARRGGERSGIVRTDTGLRPAMPGEERLQRRGGRRALHVAEIVGDRQHARGRQRPARFREKGGKVEPVRGGPAVAARRPASAKGRRSAVPSTWRMPGWPWSALSAPSRIGCDGSTPTTGMPGGRTSASWRVKMPGRCRRRRREVPRRPERQGRCRAGRRDRSVGSGRIRRRWRRTGPAGGVPSPPALLTRHLQPLFSMADGLVLSASDAAALAACRQKPENSISSAAVIVSRCCARSPRGSLRISTGTVAIRCVAMT